MTLHVQVVSPEQVLFEGDAEMVVCRTIGGGDIAFLTGHAPLLGALATWPVRLILEGDREEQFAVHGGFVEVSNDKVIILSDVAELQSDIDEVRAREALARAQAAFAADPNDLAAAAAAKRAEVRLEVAGQS